MTNAQRRRGSCACGRRRAREPHAFDCVDKEWTRQELVELCAEAQLSERLATAREARRAWVRRVLVLLWLGTCLAVGELLRRVLT